jgi:hypothetical protein
MAEKISFDLEMHDSTLILPKGFPISKQEKFRNQQVLVVIEVPVGKKIQVSDKVNDFSWFNISSNRRGLIVSTDNGWENSFNWETNYEYVMTPDGLSKTSDLDQDELKNGRFKIKIDQNGLEIEGSKDPSDKDTSKYRYKKDVEIKVDSAGVRISTAWKGAGSFKDSEAKGYSESEEIRPHADLGTPIAVFSRLFQ